VGTNARACPRTQLRKSLFRGLHQAVVQPPGHAQGPPSCSASCPAAAKAFAMLAFAVVMPLDKRNR